MKKLLFSAVIFSAMLISAAEVPLFPAGKKSTQVTHAAVESAGDNHKIAFKLASGTAEDFAIGSIYVFVDQDPKTGRKGIGNEYFIDIAKAMISSYAADGKGTLHRKAVSAKRRSVSMLILHTPKVPAFRSISSGTPCAPSS